MASTQLTQEDEDYLKQEHIGKVISKAMAKLYRTQPENPVDFLGKWLLNVAHDQKLALQREVEQNKVGQAQTSFSYQQQQVEKATAEQDEQILNKEKQKSEFVKQYEHASDLMDQMQNLADHLKEESKATAVYIGKVIKPYNKIKEDDNDRAHYNEDKKEVIRFCFADSEHQYIVDKTLSQETGLTYDVFTNPEENEEEKAARLAAEAEPELDEEGNVIPKEPVVLKEVLPVSLLVQEVVREPRIHFFKVPRLGSYMACRLEYQSCLFEEALDAGVNDMVTCNEKRRVQQDEIAAFQQAEIERKEEAEANSEDFEPRVQNFEEIKSQDYKTRVRQFVVCINTLGQDRCLSEDEQLYAKRVIQKFRDQWESIEKVNLEKDILKKVQTIEKDKIYKEQYEVLDQQEIETRGELLNAVKEGEHFSEEQRHLNLIRHKFDIQTKTFHDPEGLISHQKMLEREKQKVASGEAKPAVTMEMDQPDQKYYPCASEQFKKNLLGMKKFTVIKFPRILQTLFYMLGYKNDEICEPATNALDFKKAKELINESLFRKMGQYKPYGPRAALFLPYQKIAFLKRNISEMQVSEVEEYMLVMGKLTKWINLALDIRCQDVVKRRDDKEFLKMDRRAAEEATQARENKFKFLLDEQTAIWQEQVEAEIQKKANDAYASIDDSGDELEKKKEDARDAVLNEKRPEFDLVSFTKSFDEENLKFEIPPAVVDDIDNDYDLSYTAPSVAKGEE